MNEFRNKILGGMPAEGASLLKAKTRRGQPGQTAESESFDTLNIARDAKRGAANHRGGDRHRLTSETVRLVRGGEERDVTLVNLSGGGAMIENAPDLRLWDKIELSFGEGNRLEAIVRWIRKERVGLEFAHETRIEASEDELAALLRDVIQRSFSDVALAPADTLAEPADDEPVPVDAEFETPDQSDREWRHPLIWSGLVHANHESTAVRLRNISAGGAMVEGDMRFKVGDELLLDLGDAGSAFGTVHWARGDQAGLKFHAPYDVARLAKARPDLAGPRWVAPDYLRADRSATSPWAKQWGRADLGRLHRSLEQKRLFTPPL